MRDFGTYSSHNGSPGTFEAGGAMMGAPQLGRFRAVALLELSRTNARVSGHDLPPAGAELIFKSDAVEVFATAAWTESDRCGLLFEEPLTERQLGSIGRKTTSAVLVELTPEDLALREAWAGRR